MNIYFSSDVIIWELGKRAESCISCTSGNRKMKANSKGKFEANYLFLKLFLTPRAGVELRIKKWFAKNKWIFHALGRKNFSSFANRFHWIAICFKAISELFSIFSESFSLNKSKISFHFLLFLASFKQTSSLEESI